MKNLLLAIALCFCQMIWAAENTSPVQNTDGATAEDAIEQTESDQQTETELIPAAEELVLAEIDIANEEEEEPSRRFIPTEQISQDLGVSFPVDI